TVRASAGARLRAAAASIFSRGCKWSAGTVRLLRDGAGQRLRPRLLGVGDRGGEHPDPAQRGTAIRRGPAAPRLDAGDPQPHALIHPPGHAVTEEPRVNHVAAADRERLVRIEDTEDATRPRAVDLQHVLRARLSLRGGLRRLAVRLTGDEGGDSIAPC